MSPSYEGVLCPICQSADLIPFLTCKDHTTSGELFHVEQCSHCRLLITNPRPKPENAAHYYESSKYTSHTDASNDVLTYIYQIIKYLAIRWKYRLLQKYNKGARILDIGCGTGSFLQYCLLKGKQIQGVEPSIVAKEICQKKNIPVRSNLNDLEYQQFDVITLWHVLEHLYDLHGTMDFLTKRLENNGTIFIAVPNHESFDAQYYQQHWAAYDVPRHLWHFSKDTMNVLAQKYNLKIRAIHPMKLDAYYVSLLSEKYITQAFTAKGILRAMLTGLKSNFKAAQKKNHSSLIYVMSK